MSGELKILLLEDSKTDAELILHELRKAGMEVISRIAETKDTFDEAIKEFHPDAILADHTLHKFNSIDALQIFKKHSLNIPFILVTGTVSEEFAVSMMKEGADDYILKQNMIRLPAAISQAIDKKQLEKEKMLAMEQLTQKNKELTNLIYRCSHDLRAPLTSFMGLIDLAKYEQMSEKLSGFVNMMEKSVMKMDSILKGFTEYIRIMCEKGETTEVFFKTLVNDILQSLANNDGYKVTKFIIDIKQARGLKCNKDLLYSILQNLIHNAILYRKNEGAEVHISISESNNFFVIEIKDNGIGIPEKIQGRIFEMFYRGSSKIKGSGLGLYLVKTAVVQLNGNITMQSRQGEGTSFKITLPRTR